jgi:hypothetical protein
VRSLDEAVEEVREDNRLREQNRRRRREQKRVERAHLKAVSRGHAPAALPERRATPQVEIERADGAPPASSEPEQLPLRNRPSLPAPEEDTMALRQLDTLERKLKDLEQQFG